jgi:hypothetical protein
MIVDIPNTDPELVRALRSVFESSEPRLNRFTSAVTSRGLLFPVEYHLTEDWFNAVRAAAEANGEQRAFFGWADGAPGGVPLSAKLIDLQFTDYRSAASQPLQAFLLSRLGSWGLRTTDERVALIGGTRDFVGRVFEETGDSPQDHLCRFGEYLEENPTIGVWGRSLVSHVARAD